METSSKQTLHNTEDNAISLQVDSHASHTALQASDSGKKMSDIFGRKCLGLLEKYSRGGLLERMFAGYLVGMKGWYSKSCALTWKVKDTKSKRLLFQLQASALRTEENEFGLLLKTPSAMDAYSEKLSKKEQKMGNSGTLAQEVATGFIFQRGLLLTPTTREDVMDLDKFKQRMEKYPNGTTMPNLATQVMGLLPTPRTADVEGGLVSNVQTDGVSYFRENAKGVRWGVKLRDVVENGLLPTPKTQDSRHAMRDRGKSNLGEEMSELAFQNTGKTSQLSPLFVEEMMGFPRNWTVLPFQSGEEKA